MPHFTITGLYTAVVIRQTSFEVEAGTESEALQMAEDQHADGDLDWRDFDTQKGDATFDAAEFTPADGA